MTLAAVAAVAMFGCDQTPVDMSSVGADPSAVSMGSKSTLKFKPPTVKVTVRKAKPSTVPPATEETSGEAAERLADASHHYRHRHRRRRPQPKPVAKAQAEKPLEPSEEFAPAPHFQPDPDSGGDWGNGGGDGGGDNGDGDQG